jgi:ubiquinone/menaquinone biosynthesis C-methylase UbiE
MQITDLPKDLTADELCAALPFYVKPIPVNSTEGRRKCATITRGMAHLVLKEMLQTIRQGHRGRSQIEVYEFYNRPLSNNAEIATADYTIPGRQVLYRIGDQFIFEVETKDMLCISMRVTGDIVSALNPTSICEVGCGSGRNLIYLANRFPRLSCSGFELTAGRVEIAQRLQALDLPATSFGRFYGLSAGGMENVRTIRFSLGSAFELPALDRSYDLVFTFAALEQMQLGIEKALAEIRRIARQYVLLYEPFADVNGPLERLFLWSRNYFRMQISALAAHGLEPIRVWANIPRKPTFAYAFVLCRVV